MNTSALLTLGLAAALGACALAPANPPEPYEADPKIAAPAQLPGDRFAFDMFRELTASQKGNVTFSPASLEAVLQLLRQSAAGATRAEFDALSMGKEGVASAMKLENANALFAADNLRLKPTTIDVHRTDFGDARAAAGKINGWCDEKTHGLIPSIVSADDLGADTRLVAINAIYLKEKWLRPFNERATQRQGKFHKADGSTMNMPLMRQTAKLRYAEGEDWQAVALFYRRDGRAGEPACFIGILPKGGARDFAQGLTQERYDAIRLALAQAPLQDVAVTLPKMDVDSGTVSLKSALNRLGLRTAFSDAADFSGLAEERLRIDEVLQRCHVIVSEKETEAAAVTAVILKKYTAVAPGARPKPKVIRFDKPFVWAIGDLTTGAPPCFIGLFEGNH